MDEWDAYFWPNSNVLKNKAGLTNAEALRAFEYEAWRQRAEQLRLQPIPGRFDTTHYRAIHRYLFQDAYEWAGEFRKIEFSKGSSTFAPLKTPTHSLESWGEKILADLAAENHLKGLKKAAFVERLTHHYGEINIWHPMREGNGRATKEFLFQLAKEAGYELEFDRVNPKTWNTAAERQVRHRDRGSANRPRRRGDQAERSHRGTQGQGATRRTSDPWQRLRAGATTGCPRGNGV
jgi:cell filamentation protein